MLRTVFGTILLTTFAAAQTRPPEFAPGGTPAVLSPGAIAVIYGNDFAPPGSRCIGQALQQPQAVNPRNPFPQSTNATAYPPELCGVRVLIGGQPAGLLFVGSQQII